MDRLVALGLFVVVAAAFAVQAAARYRPEMYYEGDCPYYISTTLSLWHDRDIDLRNQLRGGLFVHGRQIALGRDGQWYPKHPLLMSLLALPFYATLGMPGFALFGLVILGGLAMALYRLARVFAGPVPAAGGALLMFAGTFLRRYDYNVTPDLLAALVAALGLLFLLRGFDAASGCAFGLAVLAKLTNLTLLPFAWLYALLCRGGRGLARTAAASAGPIGVLLTLNLALFGSPFVSSYDRNVLVQDGAFTVVSHRSQFDRGPLRGLWNEFFDRDHGLVPTSPALWLALPGFAVMLQRHRREAALALLMGEFQLLLFATYRYWATTRYGNRFLILIIVLAAAPTALTLEWVGERLKTKARAAAAEERKAAQSGS